MQLMRLYSRDSGHILRLIFISTFLINVTQIDIY